MSKNTQLGNLVNGIYVDSTGKVGVGTQSPSELLTISAVQPNSVINYTSASDYGRIYFSEAGAFKAAIQFMGSTFAATARRNALEIVNTTTGDLALGTGDARTFYIKNGGNVGIGTSSPTSIGTGYATVDIRGTNGGGVNFGTTSALGFIYADAGALDLGTYGSQVIRMYQGSNLRFIVAAASGNVSIGTATDNGYKLNVGGSIYASGGIVSNSSVYGVGGIGSQGNIVIDYGYAFGLNSNTQNAANAWNFYVSSSFSNNLRFFYGGTGVGTGSAKFQIDTGGGYTGISDINKKKDIALSKLGLAEIIQLKPSTFKFKDDVNEEEQIGFIAQEVKDVIPYAYYEDKEGDDKFIGLKQAAFIPVLVKAIQELKAEIDILKNK